MDQVLHEIGKQEDQLHKWVAARRERLFVPLDRPIQEYAKIVINRFPSLVNPSGTRGQADPFVIALAAVRHLTVVSEEHSKPTKPRIPDVCRVLGIKCVPLVEVFREQRWTW